MTEKVLIVLSTRQNRNFGRKPHKERWKKIVSEIISFLKDFAIAGIIEVGIHMILG